MKILKGKIIRRKSMKDTQCIDQEKNDFKDRGKITLKHTSVWKQNNKTEVQSYTSKG
jgi:hypothetical protein